MSGFKEFMKTTMLPAECDDEQVVVGMRLAYEAGLVRAAEIATEHAAEGPYFIALDLGIKITAAIKAEIGEKV